MKKQYSISSNGYSFDVNVQKFPDKYIIQYGGIKKSCVYITIYRKADEADRSQAQLEGISYDQKCSLEENLAVGSGTITMLKVALSFTRRLFPFVTSFRFKDTSMITCKNKVKVSLACSHFVKYGKTWYQDKYDAVPLFKDDQNKMDKAFSYINDKDRKGDFNRFWKKYVEAHLGRMKGIVKEGLYDNFKECWDENMTIHDFFKALLEMDCMFTIDWLEDYLRRRHNVFLNGAEFVISKDFSTDLKIKVKDELKKGFNIKQDGGKGLHIMDFGDARSYL